MDILWGYGSCVTPSFLHVCRCSVCLFVNTFSTLLFGMLFINCPLSKFSLLNCGHLSEASEMQRLDIVTNFLDQVQVLLH